MFQKSYLAIILYLFFINISLFHSQTTDFEMNRVCKAGKFDKYKQKTGYRTAQHFADDDGMYVTSAHSFYRSLFMTREKKNKNLFISSIGFELFIVALGGAVFINYIIFIVLWCLHKCFFRILSEEEKQEKQKGACKFCKFFVMFLCFLISIAFSVFGIMFIFNFKDSINLSNCGYLRFTNHGLYGDSENYAGAYNLREAFLNYSYSIKSIDDFISSLYLINNNNINTSNTIFENNIDSCNEYSAENSILTPNPDGDEYFFIKVNYQELYGPKTNASTMIGIIYKYYNDKIVPVLETLEEIKKDYIEFQKNKDDYVDKFTQYSKYFDVMTQMYDMINSKIGRVYDDYTDAGVKKVYYLLFISYLIFPVVTILLLIFIFVYVCKKQVGHFVIFYGRIIINVLWNIIFILSSLGLILSGYIGSYRRYSFELTPSFNYLISSGLIRDTNSEENIFIDFASNEDISRGVEIFSDCYNSSQSTNLANILNIKNNLLLICNKINKDYKNLLKYVYHNNINEDFSSSIEGFKYLLNTYLYNISKTTSPNTHLEHDVSKYFQELNKYTDFGNKNRFQIDCVTKMYDIWSSNKDDCPQGYVYSIDGSQEKNCLVMSDSEWTSDLIDIRYSPICKMLDGESTGDKIKRYWGRLKQYYEKNYELISNMKNGADTLITVYNNLINNFNIELTNDNETFINFTFPFSKFTNEENIFNIFDCGILKQDLIDFYHIVRHNLSSICLAHLVFLLLIGIFNITAIYFLILVIYTFNRTDDSKRRDSKYKETQRTNDKVLTINKSKKRKSTNKKESRKSKAKLYVKMGKHNETETPSSSSEYISSSKSKYESGTTSQNEEDEEESEEKTGSNRTSSYQTGSEQSGSKESESNSRSKSGSGSGTGSQSKSRSKSKPRKSTRKKSKRSKYSGSGSGSASGSGSHSGTVSGSGNRMNKGDEEEEDDEEEIESGVRDDGSAMS